LVCGSPFCTRTAAMLVRASRARSERSGSGTIVITVARWQVSVLWKASKEWFQQSGVCPAPHTVTIKEQRPMFKLDFETVSRSNLHDLHLVKLYPHFVSSLFLSLAHFQRATELFSRHVHTHKHTHTAVFIHKSRVQTFI